MLELNAVSVRYGRVQALTDVTLKVRRDSILTVLGANGAGKSTLLRSVMALSAYSGRITLEGAPLEGLQTFQRARAGIALVPEGRRLFADFTVAENLRIGAISDGAGSSFDARIDHVCEFFPVLRQRFRQRAGTLSGGEGQMLAIGRALMSRPRVLLLDEPSVGLMPKIVTEMFAMIRDLSGRGLSVLLVEQNARKALQISDDAIVLETGRAVLEGPAAELMDDPRVVAAYLGGGARHAA